jgi:chromate transporter
VNPELRELSLLFLKLGSISFGGPAAHVAMMEDEVVRRRQWLTREQFLDYVGATNLIPGPNSTELAIHIGHLRAGWRGLVVAGICFILPAVLIVGTLAWVYVRFHTLPQSAALLYGVKPVVIGVVLQALYGLGKSALKSRALVVLAVSCVTAAVAGVNELLILLVAGGLMAAACTVEGLRSRNTETDGSSSARLFFPMPPFAALRASFSAPVAMAAPAAASFGLWALFGVFLKIGAVLFGSGYVLLAFLRSDLVERLGWLTERQLLDAIAIGQVTPGPVFTTATFVGYVLGGSPGALVATVGIFLPAFAFVALSGSVVPRIRRSRIAGGALDGVNAASLALMAVVTWQLGRSAVVDVFTTALSVASVILLIRYRVNSATLVLGGAVMGVVSLLFRTY